MAYTTIDKSSLHFNTKLYTGTGSSNAITGVGFQPDWTWIKNRSASDGHHLYDVVRGVTKRIRSDTTAAEATTAQGLTAFGTDGFTVGTEEDVNTNSESFVSWNWKAGNSAGSSNSDGNLTSTVSANTTAGFSIVKYTSDGSGTTIGHGLGVEPNVILLKNRSDGENWVGHFSSIHSSSGNGNNLYLNLTNANSSDTQTVTARSATTFTCANLGGPANASSAKNYIAYCFAEKKGFSKFGKYTGNGSADGTFVYTGFKPAFVLIKNKSATESWYILDNQRPGYNDNTYYVRTNTNDVEGTSTSLAMSLVSNGFKINNSDTSMNTSGNIYVYMAFAEAPLVGSNNIPATAK